MKLKLMFFVLLLAVIALNALPVYATDLSGYVKATWGVDWTWRDGVGEYANAVFVQPESGKMSKYIWQVYIKNIADFPMTSAVFLISIVDVHYTDQVGVINIITDPVEIAQLIRLENSAEMWQGNYVTRLGTIQPGHSKRLTFNWWHAEALVSAHGYAIGYEFQVWQGVWYLP